MSPRTLIAPTRIVESRLLTDGERLAVRRLLDAAFDGDFSEDDWQHALGGWHAIVQTSQAVVAHASVTERRLFVESRSLQAGYVEAVAVAPGLQGTGLGTAVMSRITALVRERFELGALSTGAWHFFERLGWERWRGPTWVRGRDGLVRRTEDEDEGVMVLRTAGCPDVDLAAAIMCEERPGDCW